MRNANKEITIFNFFGSSEDPDAMLSKRTHVEGVSVFCQTKVTVVKEGLVSANVYTIRIPQESVKEEYYRPGNFGILSDKSKAFTLAKGDLIVLGYAADENPRPSELEAKYGYEYVVTITGVTDNREKQEPHWKVIGQ